MKIAIHKRSGSFSDKWIEYCERNSIEFKVVNCYDSDIIEQMKDCDGLMWHWAHYDFKAFQFARQLTYSLEASGKFVYPNSNTAWHFDDKVGQKYLLEAIGAPLVNSYVFFEKEKAYEWINNANFPLVFKLRGGAGASNVLLVNNKKRAKILINKSFKNGIKRSNSHNLFKDRFLRFQKNSDLKNFFNLIKGIVRCFVPYTMDREWGKDKGYVYFQDFVPDNKFDIRVVVIGDKAVAEKRFVRKNDFRASGSGEFSYEGINDDAIQIAFAISERLSMQSVAFDFVYTQNNKPLIVEMSYAFGLKGISKVPGYWNKELKWVNGVVVPEFMIIRDFLQIIEENNLYGDV